MIFAGWLGVVDVLKPRGDPVAGCDLGDGVYDGEGKY